MAGLSRKLLFLKALKILYGLENVKSMLVVGDSCSCRIHIVHIQIEADFVGRTGGKLRNIEILGCLIEIHEISFTIILRL